MAQRKPKEYKVTVETLETTPEEKERIEKQIRKTLYEMKLIALRRQKEGGG